MISDAEIKEYINNELYVRAEYIVDEMIKKVNGECIVYLECIVYDEKNNIILEEKNYMDMKELCLSNIELYNAFIDTDLNEVVTIIKDKFKHTYKIISCGNYDVPKLTNDYVGQLSEKSSNIQEYVIEISELLKEQKNSERTIEHRRMITNKLIEESSFEISKEQVAKYAVEIAKACESEANLYGGELYGNEIEENEFFNSCYNEAEKYVKEYLVIGAIASSENISVNEDEIQSVLKEFGYDLEVMQNEEMITYLRYQILREKVYKKISLEGKYENKKA